MKKSYIRIILFISILSFIFLSNSFVFRKLETTGLNIIMLLSLVVFYMILGFEKDKHRYVKDVILEIVIFLIAFFLVYYLFGIIIGFAKNTNYFTIKSFLNIIIPIIENLCLIFFILRDFFGSFPQCGHCIALSLISCPQFGHLIKAILFIPLKIFYNYQQFEHGGYPIDSA